MLGSLGYYVFFIWTNQIDSWLISGRGKLSIFTFLQGVLSCDMQTKNDRHNTKMISNPDKILSKTSIFATCQLSNYYFPLYIKILEPPIMSLLMESCQVRYEAVQLHEASN